ncbi:MAG TPA: ASPIC/UnbV domain-containing protein, partial [Bryobacteraceae bacterium]|nr:ASPIC/UnbV domain-containing protein [Bryobacteraceae bacterium]
NQNELPSLLKNHNKPAGNWVLLQLEGVRANRSAIGALVTVTAGGRSQRNEVRSGGSYLSQNDLRLHFGLGSAQRIDSVEIRWPGGGVQTLRNLGANRVIRIREDVSSAQASH